MVSPGERRSSEAARSQKIEAIPDLEARLSGDRTRFGDQDVDDVLRLGRERIGRAQKDRFALGHGFGRPALIGRMRRIDRARRLGRAGLMDFGEEFTRCGIVIRGRLVPGRADPFSADVKIVGRNPVDHFECFGHDTLLGR